MPRKAQKILGERGGLEKSRAHTVVSEGGRGTPHFPHLCLLSWSGSHLRWGQPLRIRHVTTGRYLALTEDQGLVVVDASKAHTKATSFCFRVSKVCGYRGDFRMKSSELHSASTLLMWWWGATIQRRLTSVPCPCRRSWIWLPSGTWRVWALRRSNMGSPCVLCSTWPQAYGSPTLPQTPRPCGWECSRRRCVPVERVQGQAWEGAGWSCFRLQESEEGRQRLRGKM